MTHKTLASHYEEFYNRASSIPQQVDPHELELFASLAPSNPPLRILDLGCAEGLLAIALAKRGHKVTAADISEKQIQKVATKAQGEGLQLFSVQCDIESGQGKLENQLFDLIYLMDVIEHFKNPVAALENIRSLMAPEARLIIHTPNVFSLDRLIYYVLRPRKLVNFRENRKLWDFHFQTYDYMTLEKTLNFIGFKVDKAIPTRMSIPYLFRTQWLARLFPFLADTLLLSVRLVEPINVDEQILFWEKSLGKSGG